MLRVTAIFVILSWFILGAMPVYAGLNALDCCANCKNGFCPTSKAKAPEHSCHEHSKKNDCMLKAGCDHTKNIVLFSFEALLPDGGVPDSNFSEALLPDSTVLLIPGTPRIEIPPPRTFFS
jgi:hypothetical protein